MSGCVVWGSAIILYFKCLYLQFPETLFSTIGLDCLFAYFTWYFAMTHQKKREASLEAFLFPCWEVWCTQWGIFIIEATGLQSLHMGRGKEGKHVARGICFRHVGVGIWSQLPTRISTHGGLRDRYCRWSRNVRQLSKGNYWSSWRSPRHLGNTGPNLIHEGPQNCTLTIFIYSIFWYWMILPW